MAPLVTCLLTQGKVSGSIPGSGLRKLIDRRHAFGCWLRVQLYQWRHAKVVPFGGSGGICSTCSMESMESTMYLHQGQTGGRVKSGRRAISSRNCARCINVLTPDR